jgi:hypothetical protein
MPNFGRFIAIFAPFIGIFGLKTLHSELKTLQNGAETLHSELKTLQNGPKTLQSGLKTLQNGAKTHENAPFCNVFGLYFVIREFKLTDLIAL